MELDTLTTFLPNHSEGSPGAFSGTLVKDGEYDIFGRTLYDGKLGKIAALGKIRIPEDLLNRSQIPNDLEVMMNQGKFLVYVERVSGKVRARIFGRHTDEDMIRVVFELSRSYQIDNTIDDNGRLRLWKILDPNTMSFELMEAPQAIT